MALNNATTTGNKYLHTGRGPLDAKALVQTYQQLISVSTWTEGNSIIAYNGMITAVWGDSDNSRNGVYFLHDASVKTQFSVKAETITNEANWHKLGGLNDLPGLTEQITTIQTELNNIKSNVDDLQDSATVVVNLKSELPKPGVPGKIYVVTDEAMTYVWYNGDYLPVGDGGDNDEIQIIHGGGASR